MIQYDQFEDYSPQEVRFANSVEMLLEALYDDEGYVRDIADAEGRKKLIETIEKMPKEVRATLGKDDRELIRALIQECKETKLLLHSLSDEVRSLRSIVSSQLSKQ